MSSDGAWSPSHVYTVGDVREVVTYAAARGIRVIPEFDTPGHVARGWEKLGVLTQCYDATSGAATGLTGPLNPPLNATYDVLEKLYTDILAAFAPETFVHVGGDEVSKDCWQSNPQIVAWLKSHPEVQGFAGLETYFEQRLLDMLHAKGASYAPSILPVVTRLAILSPFLTTPSARPCAFALWQVCRVAGDL